MKMNLKIFATTLLLLIGGLSYSQTQTFTSPGGATFTVPASCLTIKVECVGGGGGGGRVTPSNPLDNDAAGGGGGGAYAMSIIPVSAGNIYNLFVGAGGTNTGTSTEGEDSWWDTNVVLAEGGETRTGNDNEAGMQGGQALNSIGDITYNGGNGGNGNEGDADGGGGGGAAGSVGNGLDGVTVIAGGPTPAYGGYGGQGGDDGAHGATGGTYGGGGGGSSSQGSQDRNGGPGGSGIVVVTWTEVTGFTPQTVCTGSSQNILVTGSNFTNVDSVTVNGVPVTYNVDSNIQISILDLGSATSGEIIVYTDHGSSTSLNPLAIIDGVVNVSADVSGTVLTANYSGGPGASYQWIDCLNGNTPISGETNAVFTAGLNGLYAVEVVENGCTVQSSCFTVGSVSINDQEQNTLQIFPNPSSGKITIRSDGKVIDVLNVFSITGQLLIQLNPTVSAVELDLSHLTEGIYITEVVIDGYKKRSQLIIEGSNN